MKNAVASMHKYQVFAIGKQTCASIVVSLKGQPFDEVRTHFQLINLGLATSVRGEYQILAIGRPTRFRIDGMMPGHTP